MTNYDIRVIIYTIIDDLQKAGFEVEYSWCSIEDELGFHIIKDGLEIRNTYRMHPNQTPDIIEQDLIIKWNDARRRAKRLACPQKTSFAVDFRPQIEKVIFNDPATIVFWKDGSKTITKCGELDIYDPEKGLAMCFAKKLLGNEGNYYNIFTEWLPKEEEEPDIEYGASFDEPFRQVKEACNKLYDKITAGDGGH